MRYILILLSTCLLLSVIWFHSGNVLGGGDEGLMFYSPNISANISKTTWVEYSTGLATITWLSRATLLYFYSILEKISIPTFLLQASLFFTIMLVGVVSVYSLCLIFLGNDERNRLISFVTAIFYLFNPFTVSQIWARGQSAHYLSFALLPLSLVLFTLGIKSRNYLYAFLTVFSSFIFSAAYGVFSFIIVYWLILGICLLSLSTFKKISTLFFSISFFLLTFVLWVLVHSWWLIPLFLSSGSVYSSGISGAEENLGTLLGVSRNFTPDILIRLLHRTYFFDPSSFSPIYASFIFQLISWMPVVFLLAGLYIIITKRLTNFKFFIIIFLFGLIVSLGANPPFGGLFVEVFKRVTILQVFRNPFEKFGLVFILGYSLFFAYGLVSFFAGKRYKNLAITTVLFLICGIFAWPMWTGRVIAGPDRKIGLSVPAYYKDLQGWLDDTNEDYRVFMTPIWGGDGAFYQWDNGGRFQGSDPMIYLLNQPTISNGFYAPISYEFIPNIRKYIDRVNIAPSLSLLRAKYLINRQDAVFITEFEKDHKRYLTETIHPPQKESLGICKNLNSNANGINPAWITCPIADTENNWSKIRYLHLKIKTDIPSFLDIAIMDRNGVRVRWDGRFDKEYSTGEGLTLVTIPLGNPTEHNFAIDYSKVYTLEIQARSKDKPELSVNEINLEEINLDPGKEERIDNFRLIKTFGNLEVYEPIAFKSPPKFGSLTKIFLLPDFISLFTEVEKQKNSVENSGFLVTSQNTDKDLSKLNGDGILEIEDKYEVSSTRFWLKTNGGRGFILLSKTFDPQWLVLPGISSGQLAGNIFDDLKLLNKEPFDEENHFAVNGYANLWTVDGEQEYAIIYKPQVIVDIGAKISKYSLFLISGVLLLLLVKRYVKKN